MTQKKVKERYQLMKQVILQMINTTVNIEIQCASLSAIKSVTDSIKAHVIKIITYNNEENHLRHTDSDIIPSIIGERITLKVDSDLQVTSSGGHVTAQIDTLKLSDTDTTTVTIDIHSDDTHRVNSIINSLLDVLKDAVSPIQLYTGDNDYLIPAFDGYVTMKVNGSIKLESSPVDLRILF